MNRIVCFAGVFMLTSCLIVLSSPSIYAQSASAGDEREDEHAASREMDSDEDMAQDEMSGYIKGSVLEVNAASKTLVVMEDDGGDTFTFFVKGTATIEGADSLSDIASGDKVKVDYYDFKGRNVAENIDVEETADAGGQAAAPTLQKVLSD